MRPHTIALGVLVALLVTLGLVSAAGDLERPMAPGVPISGVAGDDVGVMAPPAIPSPGASPG